MTKAQLIAALGGYADDEEVFVESPTGNYWRDALARPIEVVHRLAVKASDYHRGALKIDEEHGDRHVVILCLED